MPPGRRARARLAVVALLTLGAPVACAAEDRSLYGAGGVVWPHSLSAGPWLAAGARLPLGGVSLEPEVGFWSRSETAFGVRASVKDLHAGMGVTFGVARIGPARLRLGAGAAAHFIRDSGGLVTGETASDSAVRPGAHALVSLEFGSGGTRFFVGGRSDWVVRREFGAERETRVYVGVRFKI